MFRRRWRGWVVEEEMGGEGGGGEKIGGAECLGGRRWRGWVVEEEMGGGRRRGRGLGEAEKEEAEEDERMEGGEEKMEAGEGGGRRWEEDEG